MRLDREVPDGIGTPVPEQRVWMPVVTGEAMRAFKQRGAVIKTELWEDDLWWNEREKCKG